MRLEYKEIIKYLIDVHFPVVIIGKAEPFTNVQRHRIIKGRKLVAGAISAKAMTIVNNGKSDNTRDWIIVAVVHRQKTGLIKKKVKD